MDNKCSSMNEKDMGDGTVITCLSVKHISVAADSLIALRDFLTKFNYIKDLLETYEAGRVVLLH